MQRSLVLVPATPGHIKSTYMHADKKLTSFGEPIVRGAQVQSVQSADIWFYYVYSLHHYEIIDPIADL